jgi:hypothetical protein
MTIARHCWIRAVDKICVEQLICCQKCQAIACRAIAIRAVHPRSFDCRCIIGLIFDIVKIDKKSIAIGMLIVNMEVSTVDTNQD